MEVREELFHMLNKMPWRAASEFDSRLVCFVLALVQILYSKGLFIPGVHQTSRTRPLERVKQTVVRFTTLLALM